MEDNNKIWTERISGYKLHDEASIFDEGLRNGTVTGLISAIVVGTGLKITKRPLASSTILVGVGAGGLLGFMQKCHSLQAENSGYSNGFTAGLDRRGVDQDFTR